MIYNSIPNNVIIELLYNPINLEMEFHLINLHNYIKEKPLIQNLNQLIRFKQYITLYDKLSLDGNILERYPRPYYNIEEIKSIIKTHYNMYEVLKNDRIIAIIINKEVINVQRYNIYN